MEKFLQNRQFFNILLLVCLAVFLVLPNICLANEFENIHLKEIEKYLELPDEKVQKLIRSLVNIFYSEWINLMGSGYSTEEESAVPIIMREVARVQALNHLLRDAPIEITWGIVKGAVEMSRIFLDPYGVSVVLNKFEKETVKKAIDYGKSFLLQNEIRITPGAIEFKYTSQKGEKKLALFQYVIIYQPSGQKRGEILIRFYSPNPLAPPENKGSVGMYKGTYTELEHNLPPFIVDIHGIVEDYQWVGNPSMKINFPPSVPDLGIKPLSLLEKYLLKPIETTIKEVEIIITKVTGKSPYLVEIWNEIKSFILKITAFSPAAIVETKQNLNENRQGGLENISNIINPKTGELSLEKLIEVATQSIPGVDVKPQQPREQKQLTIEELQEMLDDIAERIDVLDQRVIELVGVRLQQTEKETKKFEEIEEIEEIEEEEEMEELEESELAKKAGQVDKIVLCERIGQPARNKVIFNEIAWMGGIISANDEWIELKNIFGVPINLINWQLVDKDRQIKIIFTDRERVSVNGFFLLERTDDDSVPGIAADLIYIGALSNSDEALYLFDGNCQLQDIVEANPNWPAGDNTSKRTIERKYDLSWQTSQNPGGTSKAENSSGYYVSSGGGAGGGAPPPSQPSPSYPKILISEIYIGSENNEKDDFVELFNSNEQDVDLTNWYFQRKTKGASDFLTYVKKDLFSGKIIKKHDYFLTANASSTFSADATTTYPLTEDNTLYLKNSNGEIVDKVGWGNAQDFETATTTNPKPGESIGRKWSTTAESYVDTNNNYEDFETQEPTPKAKNKPKVGPGNQLPIASFTFSPPNPFLGDEIIFNASSSTDSDGTITSYIWDFGDSNSTTTNQTTTIHSYSTSGVRYIVSLRVVDNQGATSLPATTTLNITEKPTLSVVINEIAWMGTESSSVLRADEWIELYNNTTSTIDITGWRLVSADESPDITFSTSSIPANGYYLIERTDDTTISDIIADWSGSFGYGLNNNGEKLELRNASGTLIDIIDSSSGWFAGTTSPAYISMERISATSSGATFTNWASNNLITRNGWSAEDSEGLKHRINGTPRDKNSVAISPTTISSLPFDEFSEITLTYFGSPYIIKSNLIISTTSTLKIEPGVEIKFDSQGKFSINGKISAQATSSKEIIFTSLNDSFYYGNIEFSSSSQGSIFESCQFKKINNIAIFGANPIFKNSKFKEIQAGIWLKEGSGAEFSNNSFEEIKYPQGAILVDNSYPVLKDNVGALTNQLNGIYIFGNLSRDWQMFKNENLPYIISVNSLTISSGKVLKIDPGVKIQFQTTGTGNNVIRANLIVNGTIMAEGTDNEKILFTSLCQDNPSNCNWGKIHLAQSSSNSIFKNAIIENGSYATSTVIVENTFAQFKNVEFRKNSYSLYLLNSSSTISDCKFEDNSLAIKISGGTPVIQNSNFATGSMAIEIEDSFTQIKKNSFQNFVNVSGTILVKNGYPTFEENSFSNNTRNFILLTGTVNQDWLLKSNSPYYTNGLSIAQDKKLEIESGTILRFTEGASLVINGILKAEGTQDNKITLTSLYDDGTSTITYSYYWKTIRFTSQNSTSSLKYVIVSYGGISDNQSQTGGIGAIRIENAKAELRNLSFKNNASPHLYFINSPQSLIADSEFDVNQTTAIKIEGESPIIQNLQFK